MKRKFLFFSIWFCAFNLKAQFPIIWENTFGGPWTDFGLHVATDQSSLYVLSAPLSLEGDVQNPLGSDDFWLVKVDAQTGEMLWQRSYGGTKSDSPNRIYAIGDGNFIMLGYSYSKDFDVTNNLGVNDVWLVKINPEGEILQQKSIGGSLNDTDYNLVPAGDGGYLLLGLSYSSDGDLPSSNHGNGDAMIIRLDSNLNVIWSRLYGGSGTEAFNNAISTPDKGYILTGFTSSYDGDSPIGFGGQDIWLAKIDSLGNLGWIRRYGGNKSDGIRGVTPTSDGGFMAFGTTWSADGGLQGNHGYSDLWLSKYDINGTQLWQKLFGGSGVETAGKSLLPLIDGTFLLYGEAESTNGDLAGNLQGQCAWVLCVDTNGNVLWKKCYGGSERDQFSHLIQLEDGSIVAVGLSFSSDGDVQSAAGQATGGDVWVVKFSSVSSLKNADKLHFTLKLQPNPASDWLYIHADDADDDAIVRIWGNDGKLVLQQPLPVDNKINLQTLPKGWFTLEVADANRRTTSKFLKQ